MSGPLLDGCGRGQHDVLGDPVRRHNLHHLGLAHGERAGLVEDDDVELGGVFERRGVLEQNAVRRAQAGAHHDRHRRRESQRIRAGDHEDRDGHGHGEQQRLSDQPEPHRKGRETDDDRRNHQPLRGLVRQELRRRL